MEAHLTGRKIPVIAGIPRLRRIFRFRAEHAHIVRSGVRVSPQLPAKPPAVATAAGATTPVVSGGPADQPLQVPPGALDARLVGGLEELEQCLVGIRSAANGVV